MDEKRRNDKLNLATTSLPFAVRLSRIGCVLQRTGVYFCASFFAIILGPLQILMFFSKLAPAGRTDPVAPGSFRHLVLAAICLAIAAVLVYGMRTNTKARRSEP